MSFDNVQGLKANSEHVQAIIEMPPVRYLLYDTSGLVESK